MSTALRQLEDCKIKANKLLNSDFYMLEDTRSQWRKTLYKALEARWPRPQPYSTFINPIWRSFLVKLSDHCSVHHFIAYGCHIGKFLVTHNGDTRLQAIINLDKPDIFIKWPRQVVDVICKYGDELGNDNEYTSYFRQVLCPQGDIVTGKDISAAAIRDYLRSYISIDVTNIPILKEIDEDQWKPYTTIPKLHSASDCWQGSAPTYESLCKNMFDDHKGVQYRVNGIEVPKSTAFGHCIKSEHNPSNDYAAILDIPSPREFQLILPLNEPRRQSVESQFANFATKGAIVNFHVDGGLEGLSATLDAVKVWFLAPPTPTNLETLRRDPGLYPEKYDGCVMTITGAEDVLQIPAGTIHATVTLKQGFLMGFNWFDEETIGPAFLCILHTLTADVGQHIENDMNKFWEILDCVRCQMKNELGSKVLDLWDQHNAELERLIKGRSDIKAKHLVKFEQIRKSIEGCRSPSRTRNKKRKMK